MGVVVVVFSVRHFLGAREPGTVTGILYTVVNSTAIVDGQIVGEGDAVRGVTIVKINRNDVEFKKNDQVWKQRVGQRPNPAWTEDD